MARQIRDITIVIEHTGKSIAVDKVDETMTASQLIATLGDRVNIPLGTKGILIRKLTNRQLLPDQTLESAGIEDREILIADFEPANLQDLKEGRREKSGTDLKADLRNIDHSAITLVGGSIINVWGDSQEILNELQKLRQVLDSLVAPALDTAETKQAEGLIATYAWPDQKIRIELEYLLSQSTDSAKQIIEILLDQERHDLHQRVVTAVEDREAAVSAFQEYINSLYDEAFGTVLFEEWATFARENFLRPTSCPSVWQRFPFDLGKLLETYPSFAQDIWLFLCEQEQLVSQGLFNLQEIGLDALLYLINLYIRSTLKVEGDIELEFIAHLLTANLSLPETPTAIEKNMGFVFDYLSPQAWEALRVYEYFSDRDVRLIYWAQLLQTKIRRLWLAVWDVWIKQALELEIPIDIGELNIFLSQMRNTLSLPLAEQLFPDKLPERLKEAVKQSPILFKQSIIAFRQKALLQKQWELQLKSDAAEIRRKMLPVWIRGDSQGLDELAEFMDESLGEFVADGASLNMEENQ